MKFEGRDGPSYKKVFTCEGCKWLKTRHHPLGGLFDGNYCFHEKTVNQQYGWIDQIKFSIKDDLITPFFCPFLLKKIREEKLNEIDEYKRIEEEITRNSC